MYSTRFVDTKERLFPSPSKPVSNSLLESNEIFGFIIIDGNGVSLYNVSGSNKEKLGRIDVTLTSKTRRGGQSALRFSRLREEQRHNFVRKAAELCKQKFIEEDKPNVKGLIIAGSADFKTVLSESPMSLCHSTTRTC